MVSASGAKHPPRFAPALWGFAGLATATAVWWLVTAVELVPPSGLPGPASVARAIADLAGDASFRTEYIDTVYTWAISLGLGVMVAVPVGLVLGYFAVLVTATTLVVHVGRSMPATSLIPVAIIFFGLGTSMKLALVFFSISWIILVNTIYGVRNVDPMALVVGRALGFSRFETIWRVLLPSSAPYIASGVRVATGTAFIVTLSAELLGASTGVGTVLRSYQDAQRPGHVYGGVLLVACTGMALNFLAQYIERILIRWQPSVRP